MPKLYSLADYYIPNDGTLIKRVGNSCFVYAPLPSDPLLDMQRQILGQIDVDVDNATDPDRFHITLLYIEDCSLLEINELVSEFMPPIQFEVEFAGLEILGDDPTTPALVWMVNPDPALLRLQSDLYLRAAKQNLPISPFSKPGVYKPHVTVAYLKGTPRNVPGFAPFKIPVDKFKIGRDDYETLHTIQLPTGRGNGQLVTVEELRELLHGKTILYGPQRRVISLSDGPFSLRHGTHQGQSGVSGKQGGSEEGFTHGDAGGKESGKTNTKRKDSVGNFGAKKELFNKPHHVPFNELDDIPDGEDFAELFDEQSEWEYPANEIVSSMIEDATRADWIEDDPAAIEEVKEEMAEERMQDTLDEMYNQINSYEDLPIPPEELVLMGDAEIEDQMRDLAVSQARVEIGEFEVEEEVARRMERGQLGFQDDEDTDYKFARNDDGEIIATSMSTWVGSHEGIVARYEDVYTMDLGIDPPEDLTGEQWFEVKWLAAKEHGKGYGTQMMGEAFATAANENAGLYLEYLKPAEGFYETFNPTIERNEQIAIWTPLQVQELATEFSEGLEVEKSLVDRESLDEIDIGTEGSKRNDMDLEPIDGAFTQPIDWNKLPRKWVRKINKETPQFISAEDQAVFDARKKAERKQRGVEEDQFLTDVIGKRSVQDLADLILTGIFRHGKHKDQKGVKGQQGGSAAGYTHVSPGGGKGLGTGGTGGKKLIAGGKKRDPFPGHGDPDAPSKFPDKETLEEFETGSEPGEADLRAREFVGTGLSRKQERVLNRVGLSDNPISLDDARETYAEAGISFPEDALQIAYWRALEERGMQGTGPENQASLREISHQLSFMAADKPDAIDDSTFLDFGPDIKDPRLITSLKGAEERFLDSPIIQMAAFDEFGNEVYSDKGKVSSITLPDPNEIDLRGSYIVHNHPAGNSLTKEDIVAGWEHGAAEIYASGGNRRYIASYPDALQDVPILLRQMGADDMMYHATFVSQTVRSEQRTGIDNGTIKWFDAESQHNHLVNEILVQNRAKNRFTYHVEKIEESGD